MKYYYQCPHCDGRAFLYDHEPEVRHPVIAQYASHLDGAPIQPGSIAHCDTCKKEIPYFSINRMKPND